MKPLYLLAQQERDEIEVRRSSGSIAPLALSSDELLAPQPDPVLQQVAQRIMDAPRGQRVSTYLPHGTPFNTRPLEQQAASSNPLPQVVVVSII